MSVCIKLAVRSLKKNKSRTIITLVGIVLAVLMMCTVLTMFSSVLTSAVDSIIENEGNWHISIHNAPEEKISELKRAEGVLSAENVSVEGHDVCRITLENPKTVYDFASRYLDENTEYSYHSELLSYLGISQNENIKSLITGIAAALLIIITVGAVSLIYNAFAISVSERTKEIGLLSSLGASKGHIRIMVYSEAALLGTLAIPMGITFGLLTSWALLDVFGAYMEKVLYVDMSMELHISGWTIILAAIFGYMLVFLSAGIPAHSASTISIIDNLKGEKGVIKVKESDFTHSVETLLTKRNIKREKKSFRAITFSLAVSIFLFVSANGFSMYLLAFTDAEQEKIGYDLRICYSMEYGDEKFDKLYSFIKAQNGIDEIGWFAESPSQFHSVLLNPQWVTDSYQSSEEAIVSGNTGLYKTSFYIFIISDERYAEFISKNKLTSSNSVYASAFYSEFGEDGKNMSLPILKDGKYKANVRLMSETASDRLMADINANPDGRFDYEDYYDTFFSVEIAIGSYDFPLEFRANNGGVSILIPESRISEFDGEIISKEIMIQSPNYENIQKNISDYLMRNGLSENVSMFNSAESYQSQRNLAAMIKLFSNSFLILLSVISCANVFNVMTTSLNMRNREFAVLRSLGMTVDKLFIMLCMENILTGITAALAGGAASLPLCYLLYKSITAGSMIDIAFPFRAFLTASFVMMAIMLITSIYGLCKIKKGSVIADIRNSFT